VAADRGSATLLSDAADGSNSLFFPVSMALHWAISLPFTSGIYPDLTLISPARTSGSDPDPNEAIDRDT
jgi:hypothetical protein